MTTNRTQTTTPSVLRQIEEAAVQRGFNAGREYEHKRMRAEWCDDVAKLYDICVADGVRIGRRDSEMEPFRALLGGAVSGLVSGMVIGFLIGLLF